MLDRTTTCRSWPLLTLLLVAGLGCQRADVSSEETKRSFHDWRSFSLRVPKPANDHVLHQVAALFDRGFTAHEISTIQEGLADLDTGGEKIWTFDVYRRGRPLKSEIQYFVDDGHTFEVFVFAHQEIIGLLNDQPWRRAIGVSADDHVAVTRPEAALPN